MAGCPPLQTLKLLRLKKPNGWANMIAEYQAIQGHIQMLPRARVHFVLLR